MAASTTVKVATLTGAAKDDIFTSAATGLSEDAASAKLNVLANDPGAAKLYSLVQNTSSYASTAQFPVATTATLASGAKITINADGTVGYDASGIKGALQSLAEGESFTDTFNYTVRMANGALSTAKVTVSIAGANDAPTLASVTPLSVLDTSADDTPAAVTGKLAGADVDHGAVLTYSIADGVSTSEYGSLTLNAQTGEYSFAADADKIDTLAQGETQTVSFNVQVTDEHGAKAVTTLSFNLVGANDGPTLAAIAASTVNDTAADDTPAAVTGTLIGADVDHGAVLSYSLADGSLTSTNEFGTFTVNAQTGEYSFVADADKIDSLADGVNALASFNVQVTDEHGAKAATTVDFNLVGANDVASIGGTGTGSVAEDGTLSANGTLLVSDRDAGQSSFQSPDSLAGTYGDFAFNAATGEWSYTLRNGDANVQALAGGQTVSDELVVTSLDGSVSSTIHVDIGGADEPVVTPPPAAPATSTTTNGGSDAPESTVTKYMVNHGQTDVNGKQIFTGFDSNDLLVYTNNYTLKSVGLVDTDGNGTLDSADAVFEFKHGKTVDPVEVVLIGYTDLTNAQITPV